MTPGTTNSTIAAARAEAELKKLLPGLDPDDFGSSVPPFYGFIDSVRFQFNEEATELFHNSADPATFKREVCRLREKILDYYTRAPSSLKMTKRQRRRLEQPIPIDERLSYPPNDTWDLWARIGLMPNKKDAVRKELERVLGQQLHYWLRKARELDGHRPPSSKSRQLAPEAEFNAPDETLAQSNMSNSDDKQLGSRKFRPSALEPTDRPAVRTWFRSGDAILSLRTSNGTMFEGLEAHLSPDAILVTDAPCPIEAGDMLIRTFDGDLRVGFIVDDPGYREALGSIPAHFEVKARPAAPIDTLEPSSFWRSRRSEYEELSSRQRDALGDDREHPMRLRGYCSRLEEDAGARAYCVVEGGFDSEFRSKFDDVATQSAIALGCPPDGDPITFWLFCLVLDLLQNSPDGGGSELWQPVPGGGFTKDLLGSSAAYCSRLAAKADLRANERMSQPGERITTAIDAQHSGQQKEQSLVEHIPSVSRKIVDSPFSGSTKRSSKNCLRWENCTRSIAISKNWILDLGCCEVTTATQIPNTA